VLVFRQVLFVSGNEIALTSFDIMTTPQPSHPSGLKFANTGSVSASAGQPHHSVPR
jgi:hypothetical protein